MKVTILGATGQAGSSRTAEALARGHTNGLARNAAPFPSHERLTPHEGDLNDHAHLAKVLAGHDVVIASVKFATLDAQKLTDDVKTAGSTGRWYHRRRTFTRPTHRQIHTRPRHAVVRSHPEKPYLIRRLCDRLPR